MAPEQRNAALELAVRLGLLGRCERCGQTWRRGTMDMEEGDGLDEYLDSAEDILDELPELDVFPDAESLRIALEIILRDAYGAKVCRH
jgi:hypothetical protein